MYTNEIPLNIKNAREKSGLTQKEVEQKLGLRPLIMRDYETGRLKLPAYMALLLSDLYRVSLDELLGVQKGVDPSDDDSNGPCLSKGSGQTLRSFPFLFKGFGYGLMNSDPILRAALEAGKDQLIENSVFEILTKDLSQRESKTLMQEIARFLYSLAGQDSKMTIEESRCLREILQSLDLVGKKNKFQKYLTEEYFPEQLSPTLGRIEIKHFIMWLLYFFAASDGQIHYKEIEYLDKVAQFLKLNRSNYDDIKDYFVSQDGITIYPSPGESN